jgi:predicted nuclease of predicted toxin-antitoxin system
VRFLADECLGKLIVTTLRGLGHDVVWVREEARGLLDEKVLAWSVRDERILLTEDFDYADLVFARGAPATGVVILQLSSFPGGWRDVVSGVTGRIEELQGDFPGHLSVIGRTRVKRRPLPAK